MKRFGSIQTLATIASISVGVTACQYPPVSTDNSSRTVNVPAKIEGSWVDTNGIVSNFQSGIFETRATDTNEKLAEGDYHYQSSQLVEINIRSIVRGTMSKVNCALVSPSQINCTSSAGSQFILNRRATDYNAMR